MPTTIKYQVRFDGQIVGTRKSHRTYVAAVVVLGHGKGPHVATWCGRPDLARNEQRKYAGMGYTAEIVPVEICPSNKRTAQALNDSGVFAPFTVIGEDK